MMEHNYIGIIEMEDIKDRDGNARSDEIESEITFRQSSFYYATVSASMISW